MKRNTPTLDTFCERFGIDRDVTGAPTTAGLEKLTAVMLKRMAELATEVERQRAVNDCLEAELGELGCFVKAILN